MSDVLWQPDMESVDSPLVAMLVDDQAVVAAGLRKMLKDEADIELHYCSKASEAIEMACNMSPCVILQDLFMPEIDGLTLVRHYRNRPETLETPIIVLSSEEDAKVKADAFEAGANDYLVKFPCKHELIARIRYHARWFAHKQQRDESFRLIQESQQQLQLMNEKLQEIANLDGLTGVANRRYFSERFDTEWKRARRNLLPISVIMVDIDFFKKFNDELGHLFGDDCLKKVASYLNGMCKRATDLFARYGGEEFIVLLPETALDEAKHLAEQMCAGVEQLQLRHPDSRVSNYVTISLGLACAQPAQGISSKTLIDAADKELYKAKYQGRNRISAKEDHSS